MARGVKVADIYAELDLDRGAARASLRGMPAALGPDADRAGRELGKKMSDGLAKAVEASSTKVAKARRAEVEATKAVRVAELRLNEAREKGNRPASQLLALENALEKANYRLAQAQQGTVTSTKKLDDAQRALARSMGDVGKGMGPAAQGAGDEAGGKLALGMRLSIIRNSPLIAAAVGAALAAGAPLMTTAAVGLFAGIGIVAAAQSQKVQSAWLGTWQQIKAGAIADAGVIEPTLVRLAARVGDSFERMRPQLRGIFADAAPQIEVFAAGLLGLAENALPGLERAVANGMPVTQGLASFLEKTGTGLSDFFDRITAKGPEAGQTFSLLGDTMGTLLPLLGELVGQGAELATIVLPALNGSLGMVLSVVSALGPALPVLVTGFGALKIAQTATGWIETLSTRLDVYASKGGLAAGAAGKVSGGLAGIAAAATPVGIALAAATAGFAAAKQQTDDYAQALLKGGAAAEAARAEISAIGQGFDTGSGFFDSFLVGLTSSNLGLTLNRDSARDASDAYAELLASMDPVSRTSALLTQAQNDLSAALEGEGKYAGDVEGAQRALADAQRNASAASAELEQASLGVTEAMLAQADAALALADADLANRQAVDKANESYAALNDAIREFGANSEEASDASMAWESDLNRVVATAGKLATETLPANMDANQRLALSQIAQRDALRELAAQYGDRLPPALQTALASLEATTAGYDVASLEAARLAAETEMAGGAMDKLSAKEAKPKITGDASIFAGINAETVSKLDALNAKEAVPKAKMDSSIFAGVNADVNNKIAALAAKQPTPTANMNSGPFSGVLGWVAGQIGWLGGLRPTPAVGLADQASGGISKIAAYLGKLQDRTIYVTTVERTVKQKAGGGPVESSPIFAAVGRKVIGPGGPTDDLVRAIGPGGADYRLSAGEWILNAMVSRAQGDALVSLLNAGKADIVPRSLSSRAPASMTSSMAYTAPATASSAPAGGGGTNISIGSVSLVIPGAYNLGTGSDKQRLIAEIAEGLVAYDRSRS